MTKIKPTTAWAVVDKDGDILLYTLAEEQDAAIGVFEDLHSRPIEAYPRHRVVKVRITGGEDDE